MTPLNIWWSMRQLSAAVPEHVYRVYTCQRIDGM